MRKIRVADRLRFTVHGETVTGTVIERVTDRPSFTVNGERVNIYASGDVPCSVVRDGERRLWLVPDAWEPTVI